MLKAGDLVVALRPGGQDRRGLPRVVPEPGGVYKLTSVYPMRYGLGCTLEGMEPLPYRGFFLFVNNKVRMGGARTVRPGWYFRKAQEDNKPATADWRELLKGKINEPLV